MAGSHMPVLGEYSAVSDGPMESEGIVPDGSETPTIAVFHPYLPSVNPRRTDVLGAEFFRKTVEFHEQYTPTG